MAKKWKTQDSARMMTNKYNETTEEVEQLKKEVYQLKKDGQGINKATQGELEALALQLQKKVENKSQIGLGKVDNTADSEKPVSALQARAIERAIEPMVTSEPANEIEAEDTGFITSISVSGTKLVISI